MNRHIYNIRSISRLLSNIIEDIMIDEDKYLADTDEFNNLILARYSIEHARAHLDKADKSLNIKE